MATGRLFDSEAGISNCQNDQQDGLNEISAKCNRSRWSVKEREHITSYVRSRGIENVDWAKCASDLNKTHGGNRTGSACQNYFLRCEKLENRRNCNAPQTREQGVQTDITVGPRASFVWQCGPGPEDEEKCVAPLAPRNILRSLLETKEPSTPGKPLPSTENPVVRSLFEPKDCLASIDHVYAKQPVKGVLNETKEPSTPGKPLPSTENPAVRSLFETKDCFASIDHVYAKQPVKGVHKKPTKRKLKGSASRLKCHKDMNDKLSKLCNLKSTPSSHCLPLTDCVHLMQSLKTRNTNHIVDTLFSVPILRQTTVNYLCQELGNRPEKMRNKHNGFVSVLMHKDYVSLSHTDFGDIVRELEDCFPELLRILLCIMIPRKKSNCGETKAGLVPKLALIYGIIMQTRVHELSRIQRVMGMCLADNICDQAVFDRLNRLGVSVSHCVVRDVFTELGKMYPHVLTEALRAGKYVRFVGDNLNFALGVSQETKVHHKHMVHMFTSTALVFDNFFPLEPEEPEIPLDELKLDNILLSTGEYDLLRHDFIKLVVDRVVKYLPQLQFAKDSVPVNFLAEGSDRFDKKTHVIPLPCLPFNEQKYQDDVRILDWYEELMCNITEAADVDRNMKFQIGGDQLTRERFTDAMLLRLGNIDPRERFCHIGRCVFEFFHLGMNYLEKTIFQELWNNKGLVEVGTLRGECERLSRNSVNPDVKKAYEPDKQFFLNYLTANIVEAVMEFFGMETRNDAPTLNKPPVFTSEEEKRAWVYEMFGRIVDKYVFPTWSGKNVEPAVKQHEQSLQECVTVELANGRKLQIPLAEEIKEETVCIPEPDKIKDYAHNVLEVGFTFEYFLELVKSPDRTRLLALLKIMMLQMKGRSPHAKYPREILRLFIHQYSIMGLREACQVLQSCFVNLHGRADMHVPADLVQEWNVKESKKHLRHMFSNKTESGILSRTSAIPGIHAIAENFDHQSGTLIRAKRHKKKDNEIDEQLIMDDLRRIRPFRHVEGRNYNQFPHIPKSPMEKIIPHKLQEWFDSNFSSLQV